MTNQQEELQLLAKWMGIEGDSFHPQFGIGFKYQDYSQWWNPSLTGNSDDFLNMVAEKGVLLTRYEGAGYGAELGDLKNTQVLSKNNNSYVAAMKHAAYQVCLMAAREGME